MKLGAVSKIGLSRIREMIFKLATGCCWIVLSGLQSNLVDWIVIDNPKSKLNFGFGLSIQFLHFNPNPKKNLS